MTAPGQEPDEVLTATPGGKGPAADEPDLDAIGDKHMPDDLRQAETERAATERAEQADRSDADDEGENSDEDDASD